MRDMKSLRTTVWPVMAAALLFSTKYQRLFELEYPEEPPLKLGNPGMYRALGDLATLLEAAGQEDR